MPAVSGTDLDRLHLTKHATLLRLVVYVPPTIWQTQVNGSPAKGAVTIPVDAPTVTRAPAKNYQVLFGSSTVENLYGEARYIGYSAPNLTISANNMTLPDDAYVRVKEVIQPQAIHIGMDDSTDAVLEDGDDTYNDENVKYMPLARCGTHVFAYRDATTGLATVKFYSRSTAIAAGATLAATCLWTWRGGTVTAGATTSYGTSGVPNVVTWDTSGDYYCSLKVTDSNNKTHTRYFVVFVRDRVSGTLPYTQVEVSGMRGNVESGGWSASVKVYTAADTSVFPNGGLVVLAADDWFGSENVSVGNELYRENIVLVGYIRRGSCQKNWASGYVEFDIESISGVMGNMAALATWLESTAGTPGDWHVLQNMTYNLAAHHILTQHTTVSQLCDVYPNLPTYAAAYVDLTEGSQWNQLTSFVGAVRGQAGCNAQGHLYLEVNPQLEAVGDRSTTYVLDTDFKDFREEIDFGNEPQEQSVSQIDFCGENDAGDLYFSLAPLIPWTSGAREKVDGVRCDDQAEANTFSGCFEGDRNNPFKDVTINWRGDYRIWDVFPREPFRMTIAAGQNKRGISWSNQRCWTKSVTFDYRAGILLASSVVERDAAFTAGTGVEEGATPDPDYSSYSPTLPTWTPPSYTPYVPPTLSHDDPLMWMDGWIAAPTGTATGFYGLTPCAFMLLQLQITSVQTEFTFKAYFGYANADITIEHKADNTWECKRYNGSTGALISTHAGAAGSTYSITLAGADVINVASAGLALKTELVVAGATAVTAPYMMIGKVV